MVQKNEIKHNRVKSCLSHRHKLRHDDLAPEIQYIRPHIEIA